MKNKKVRICLIISIIIIIIILLAFFKPISFVPDYDILIFNLWKNTGESGNQYIFNIKESQESTVNIDLVNTLIEEKIQPGTKGSFDIVIDGEKSKKNMEYQILFTSKNAKPANLVFSLFGDDTLYRNIEDLESVLGGIVEKGTKKIITIEWLWKYENDTNDNIQDTLDGQAIQEYSFDIEVITDEK